MKVTVFLGAALALLASCAAPNPGDNGVIDLSGQWQVRLDSATAEPHDITLPGTLDMANLGEPDTLSIALEKPQVLRLTRRHSFIGPAYYTRTIEVPESMSGRPLRLTLERVLWKSIISIDGKTLDSTATQVSLVTPHEYVIAKGLDAGSHELTLCIDNRKQYDISVDELCHSYTDATQTKWNGVLGKMELRALGDVDIERVEVYPDSTLQRASLVIYGHNYADQSLQTRIDVSLDECAEGCKAGQDEEVAPGDFVTTLELVLPDTLRHWDEFQTPRYHLTATAAPQATEGQSAQGSTCKATFALRTLATRGNRMLLNGEPVFLRGTLECCIFPLAGCPPTDEAGWLPVFQSAREWGLNHLRFHSWCPPDAAFRVADSLGFYLSVELPIWSTTLDNDSAIFNFLRGEYESVVRNYGNHPSLCLLSCGNELQHDFVFLNSFVADMKVRDPRHLYTTTSFTFEPGHGGHPEPEDQYYVSQWTDNGWVRGQGVFDVEPPSFDKNYNASMGCVNVPLITHEIGQYSVYPDLKEIDQYTGTLDPINFKAVRQDLEQRGLLDHAEEWLQASGKLAAILYKEEIERALKTNGISGYQLLGLQDFPGQGTALVGLVNAFWQSKHVVEADWFRQFCAPVVPLANFPKAVYSTTEPYKVDLQIANYSGRALGNAEGSVAKQMDWALLSVKGDTLQKGVTELATVPNGDVTGVGSLELSLADVKTAQQLTFCLSLPGTVYRNEWPVWVYPPLPKPAEDDVLTTSNLKEAEQALSQGRTVILIPHLGSLQGLEGKFLPVFWSPVHFPKQAGTMGIVCHPEHPALAQFPTEMFGNWQWWRLAKSSTVLELDSLRGCVDPIVESVDNFMRNRRLATVFEAKVGEGRLLFSAIDLLSPDKVNAPSPEMHQMLYSLHQYAASKDFAPKSQLSIPQLESLFLKGGSHGPGRSSATDIY